MTERCKSNPCCGDHRNCNKPPQFKPRESYAAYGRRTKSAPAGTEPSGVEIERKERAGMARVAPALNALYDASGLLGAAKDIVASRLPTFKARNGRQVELQDESGERMWIVPGDEMAALEAAISGENQEHVTGETWRPIESAPKDGTEILLFGHAVLVSDGRSSLYAKGRHVGWSKAARSGAFWATRDPSVNCEATHWMPLLPPPTA